MENTSNPETKEPTLSFTDNPSIYAHLERKMILMENIFDMSKVDTHQIYNPIELGIEPTFDENESSNNHVWANRGGHIMLATPSAKLVVLDAIKTGFYHGQNRYGNHIFSKIKNDDGNQIWASLKDNGLIKHLGANRPERHYTWIK